MAHEQQLVPLRTVQGAEKETTARWPVPYAIMFILGASVGLWSVILAVANWLVG